MSFVTRNPYKRQPVTTEPSSSAATSRMTNREPQDQASKKRRWTFAGAEAATTGVERRLLPTTALELLHQKRTSCSVPLFLIPQQHQLSQPCSHHGSPPSLDWLHLPAGTIHELAGPAGTGKTQIALTLCLQAAASVVAPPPVHPVNHITPPIRAIYLALGSTRMHHVLQRLHTMTQECHRPLLLQSVVTKCCVGIEDLLVLVSQTLPQLLRQEPHIRILVLDSIANVIRHDDTRTAAQRAALLFQLTAALQVLCHRHQSALSVVILNQVTADIECNNSNSWKPALGLSWEHCIHSRFQVNRQESRYLGNNSAVVNFDRSVRLVHSNQYPASSCAFAIDATGCYLVDENQHSDKTSHHKGVS